MKNNQWEVSDWAEATFGKSTPLVAAKRANEEMKELIECLEKDDEGKAIEEVADVVICLYRVATLLESNLMVEISRKMAINRARKWKVDPSGVGYHVKS